MQIFRVPLHPNAPFYLALRKVFGLGTATSLSVAEACGISKDLKVKDIKESYVQKVTAYVEEHYTTGDTLKRQIREGILQQVAVGSRRGTRHQLGLPVGSANTRSNANTAKKVRPLIMYDTSRKK